jgi:hypothetical protein
VTSKEELDKLKLELENRRFTVSIRVLPHNPQKPEAFSAFILADKMMLGPDKTVLQETDVQDRKRRERITDRWLKVSWWLIIILALVFYFLPIDILIPTFVRMVSSK